MSTISDSSGFCGVLAVTMSANPFSLPASCWCVVCPIPLFPSRLQCDICLRCADVKFSRNSPHVFESQIIRTDILLEMSSVGVGVGVGVGRMEERVWETSDVPGAVRRGGPKRKMRRGTAAMSVGKRKTGGGKNERVTDEWCKTRRSRVMKAESG